jgi:hypothetical protein
MADQVSDREARAERYFKQDLKKSAGMVFEASLSL